MHEKTCVTNEILCACGVCKAKTILGGVSSQVLSFKSGALMVWSSDMSQMGSRPSDAWHVRNIFAWFSEILQVKILQRNANLDGSSVTVGPPPEQDALAVNALKRLQDIPLDVPKKTKLWAPRDVMRFRMSILTRMSYSKYTHFGHSVSRLDHDARSSGTWSKRAESGSRPSTCTGPSNVTCASSGSPPPERAPHCLPSA